jgi:DNA-binding GntR family transcriptional regulator
VAAICLQSTGSIRPVTISWWPIRPISRCRQVAFNGLQGLKNLCGGGQVLQIIKSENLHVQAYNIIKSLILEGKFQPGEHVKEMKLAEQLGVSRGPVREAVKILVQEGLLLVQDNGRLHVYNPTFEDLVNLYQCRESLESLAASLAAKNITDAELNELSATLDLTREAIAADARKRMIDLNTEFHDKIIVASRNRELISILGTIRSKVYFMRNNGHLAYFRDNNFIEEHEAIYREIRAGNEAGSEREMRAHIKKDVEKFHTLFEKNGEIATGERLIQP